MDDGKNPVQKFIYWILCRIVFFFLVNSKYFNTGVDQEGSENVKDPVEAVNKHHANADKDDTENNGHQDADQQCPGHMIGSNSEIGKNENENKDVIYTQTPFHQIGAKVFE